MIGQGTTLEHSTDGTTFTALAKVNELNGIEMSRASSSTRYLDPGAGDWEESEPGRKSASDLDLKIKYDPESPTNTIIDGNWTGNSNSHWRIMYPDGSGHKFMGHVNKRGVPITQDDTLMQTIGIKISGPVEPVSAP